MPRTKLKKVAHKRNRNSTTEDIYGAFLTDLDREVENTVSDFEFKQGQTWGQIINKIKNLRSKLSSSVLSMTIGELQEMLESGARTYDQAEISSTKNAPLANITNHNVTFNNSKLLKSSKAPSARDDGYNTCDSSNSDVSRIGGRQMGPFQSAKAKTRVRRSQSANGSMNQSKARTQQINNSATRTATGRQSRTNFRTPATNRIQTMSADRLGPVTPKVQVGQTFSMLRYARQGETVISLGGSPVLAPSLFGSRANINIPINNGVFTVQPLSNGTVDSDIVSQIDRDTLNELRQLQDNLNMIMQVAANAHK